MSMHQCIQCYKDEEMDDITLDESHEGLCDQCWAEFQASGKDNIVEWMKWKAEVRHEVVKAYQKSHPDTVLLSYYQVDIEKMFDYFAKIIHNIAPPVGSTMTCHDGGIYEVNNSTHKETAILEPAVKKRDRP